MTLKIVASKPNPTGRDTAGGRPLARQLQGEWVDIQNISNTRVLLVSYSLDHTAFSPGCQNRQYAEYWSAKTAAYVAPGEIMRIHSGREADAIHMAMEDRIGAHIHAWTERNAFALNNGPCGDALTVWHNAGSWVRVDVAEYDSYPPEGEVLHRIGGRLVASGVGALLARYR